MDTTAKKEAFAAWQYASMVRVIDDDCIISESSCFELLQRIPDRLIHSLDGIVIFCVVHTHARQVGVIFTEYCILRGVLGFLKITEGTTFMRLS